MNEVAHGRTNIAPSKIPWDLIRTLIIEMYGGKIDDPNDFQQLSDLFHSFMTPAAFETDHKLIREQSHGSEEGGLSVPEGNDMKTFMSWVNDLPEREPPTYLGLPANAEKLLLVGHGKQTIENLVKITELLEEGEQLQDETTGEEEQD